MAEQQGKKNKSTLEAGLVARVEEHWGDSAKLEYINSALFFGIKKWETSDKNRSVPFSRNKKKRCLNGQRLF
jgi:hypothetical protein